MSELAEFKFFGLISDKFLSIGSQQVYFHDVPIYKS